jgi:hypothetical protein
MRNQSFNRCGVSLSPAADIITLRCVLLFHESAMMMMIKLDDETRNTFNENRKT